MGFLKCFMKENRAPEHRLYIELRETACVNLSSCQRRVNGGLQFAPSFYFGSGFHWRVQYVNPNLFNFG